MHNTYAYALTKDIQNVGVNNVVQDHKGENKHE